jgi:hypothetical protein
MQKCGYSYHTHSTKNNNSFIKYVENESASESETEPEIKISSPNTDKLVKRQNEIIKKLNNEIEQLKRT